jgi:hypothetical protein
MTDSSKHIELLKHFTSHEDYELDEYYGVTIMTIKKDRSFSLQLQYGYKKRAQNSSSLVIKELSTALEAYRILMKFSLPLPETEEPPSLSFL